MPFVFRKTCLGHSLYHLLLKTLLLVRLSFGLVSFLYLALFSSGYLVTKSHTFGAKVCARHTFKPLFYFLFPFSFPLSNPFFSLPFSSVFFLLLPFTSFSFGQLFMSGGDGKFMTGMRVINNSSHSCIPGAPVFCSRAQT